MNRWTGTLFAIVGCALLAVVTFYFLDTTAKTYASPQECFEASAAAAKKNDWRSWSQCLTDDFRDLLVSDDIIFFADQELKMAESAEDKARIRAQVEVQKNHGLTPEFLAQHKDMYMRIQQATQARKNVPLEFRLAFAGKVLAPVKDPSGFFDEMMRAKFAGTKNPLVAMFAEAKLTGVRIDGKAAEGILSTARQGSAVVVFRKEGESWKIAMFAGNDR